MAYKGWTNKETWLVNLWLGDMFSSDAEEGIEVTPEYIELVVDEYIEAVVDEYIEAVVDEMADDASGFLTDILNCAFGEINYHELSDHYDCGEE